MPSGNSPRVILYDQNGDVPLVGSQAVSGSIPVAIANDQIVQVSGTLFTQPLPGVTGSITGSVGISGPITGTVGLSGPVAISNFPATQSVTQGTTPWIISGSSWTPTITGSVGLSGPITGSVVLASAPQIASGSVTGLLVGGQPLSTTNPIPITGSIAVTAPAVQNVTGSAWTPTITGSVIVSNQVNVTGSVGLAGPVAVSNFPATQNVTGSAWTPTITGSVVVSNQVNVTGSVGITAAVTVLPHQITSGSVTGLLVGGQPVSSANQVPITGSVGLTGPITGSVGLSGPVAVSNFPATQSVTQGTSPWIISGSAWTPTITGSVSLSGPITGSVGIAGPVAVTQGTSPWVISGSNWTPTITGSVIVSNRVDVTGSNWIQTITGSVTVQNQVNVTGSTWIPTITGSVIVTNRVDVTGSNWTQTVAVGSGSVTGLLVGGLPANNSNPLPVTYVAPAATSSIAIGDLTLGQNIDFWVVERTAYTEQTGSMIRSIKSSNVADVSGSGLGVWQVAVTYLDVTGSGPFVEFVNMNGTTAVNTVSPNMTYIEKIEATIVGTTGSAVGNISLFQSTAGNGNTIGSIQAKDTQTFWAHHYVPNNKICKITGFSFGNNGSTATQGALFVLRAVNPKVANAVNKQISDLCQLYGQSTMFTRLYNVSPLTITGFSRVSAYVQGQAGTSLVYRAAFDFYEQ